MDRNEHIISTWNLKLPHEFLSFCKSGLHICFKSVFVHQSIKEPVLLLWLDRTTFHWVASGYKFNIMNTTFLPHLPLAYFCTTPFGTCSSLYITFLLCSGLYFCLCVLVIHDTFPVVFAVIRFLFPFHLHILYLTFASSYFEFLSKTFWNLYNIGY